MCQVVCKIRNYGPADFADYVRLHEETEIHDRAGRRASKQFLAEDLGHPRFEPEKNLFVADQDGHLIGSVGVFPEPEIGRALIDGLVHPRFRKKGLATYLFDCAVRHARSARLKVAQICLPEFNTAAGNLMARLGLQVVRRFVGMRMDLSGSRLPKAAAGDYVIRELDPGEAPQLTVLQNRSFAQSWGFNPNTVAEIAYRINLHSCAAQVLLLAVRHDQPIGYCWTRTFTKDYPNSGEKKGEIHMLGVDPDFRRKGVGRNLLLSGLSHLHRKGIHMVELTADEEDPAARALYESVGFTSGIRLKWYQKRLA